MTTRWNDPPCTPDEAVERAVRCLASHAGEYQFGTGGYHPEDIDDPWTHGASDCAGFAICWAWKLHRHRPGFNHGDWATVSDDLNCNSAIEDADHAAELFLNASLSDVRAGDLLVYPSFTVTDATGLAHHYIGHVGLVEYVYSDYTPGDWAKVDVIQCHGPNGRKPGVVQTNGAIWAHHDTIWPLPRHRTRVIRPRTR